MPFYNQNFEWNGLAIQVQPLETWRKRYPFWPYFVSQHIHLELRIKVPADFDRSELQFHLVEKMSDQDKPRIIPAAYKPSVSSNRELVFSIQNSGRITGKGEVKYWVSNRGYNVDHEPVFSAEIVSLDSWILPLIVMSVGPILGFLLGLVIGLLIGF